MTDDSRPTGTVQYLLGSISAQLSAIDNSLSRVSSRIESVERRTDVLEEKTSRQGLWSSFVEKAVWGVLGAAGIMGLKASGLI